jgi:hypothetical protein
MSRGDRPRTPARRRSHRRCGLGTLACRPLYGWSTFRGGEEIGVAALEVANLPSLVVTAIAGGFGEVSGLARLTSACRWSWLLAALFIVLASVQWWCIGAAIDRGRRLINVPPIVLAYAIAPLGAVPTSGALSVYYAIAEDDLVHGTAFMTFAVTVAYVIGLPLLLVWWIFEKAGWRGWRYYVPTATFTGALVGFWGGVDDAWEWALCFVASGMSCATVFSIALAYGRRLVARTS